MSTFSCPVVRVASVEDHPNADRLSLVRLEGLGYLCISGKLEDLSPRYRAGDMVVYIPSASVLPEWLLKDMEFWNEESGKGTLAGADGNRVKPLRLRGIFSEGVLYPVQYSPDAAGIGGADVLYEYSTGVGEYREVSTGDDVSEFLGITKWDPPIPIGMAGEVANLFGSTVRYDFERLESVPDIFEPGEWVVASEKLHGTFCALVFEPGLSHSEMFGRHGEFLVHSKGLGAQGLAFKNNEANSGNLYVRTLKALLDAGLEDRLREHFDFNAVKNIALIGEVFGRGVQDLHYGLDKPGFRVFDIRVHHVFGETYLAQSRVAELLAKLEIGMVPTVYEGPFDLSALEAVRDGRTMLDGTNIREGIVVRSATEARHEIHGRKIAKMISEAYLLRRNKDQTEFN